MNLSFFIGIFLPLTFSAVNAIGQDMETRPNILFLFADDMRAETIHALGNNEIITPHLDQLVREGVSFTNNYIMGGTSGAVCMPSRAMLLTGRTLFHLKKQGRNIPKDHTLLGEMLAAEGYTTFGIGKWHNNKEAYARCFNDGAEIFFGGMTMNQWEIALTHFNEEGIYNEHCQPGNKQICDHMTKGKHSAEIFADAAGNFLQSEKSQKPFFMYVSFTTPHDPRQMPKKYLAMYDTSNIPLPKNFLPKHPFDNGELDVRDELLLGFPRKPNDVKKEIKDYYATISHLDAQVGRIIDALKQSGQYENTIIIFAGDNGLALGQHGLLGKQNLYEHSIGVPMIWSGPGIPQNKRSEAFTYLTDVFSTLCDMLGVDKPLSVEGKSFVKTLRKPKKSHRENLFFAYKDFQRAVRDERYKLIEYSVNGERTTQLFDLKNDPEEIQNLAVTSGYESIVKNLKKELLRYKSELDDDNGFWEAYDEL